MAWIKLGSLWKRESQSGKKYLSGVFEKDGVKTDISIWPNDKGDNPKRPDFIIYLVEKRDAAPAAQDAHDAGAYDDAGEMPF